jgi:hypothetical protein
VKSPTGPGYYSLLDVIQDNERQKPPKYPYPRFSLCIFPFFDVDWRYLDKPDNQEHDIFDFLKRIRLCDDVLFTTGGEFRYRLMDEGNSRLGGFHNRYDLTRVRAYGDLMITDRFRVFVEFFSAQSFNQDLAPLVIDRDYADLLNAFADLALFDFDDKPVWLRVGRQELLYGSQRLISPLDWANTRRTFQGAKLFWRSEEVDLDAFCVQPVIPSPRRFDSVDNGVIFSGTWLTCRPQKNHFIDLYYLNLDRSQPVFAGRGGLLGPGNVSTVGARYIGESEEGWCWDGEGMLQFGTWSNQDLFAGAATIGGGYHWKDSPLSPVVWLYYDYASGEDHPGVGNLRSTFNQLFPFGHYYFGFLDLVGRQNIHDINVHLNFYPTPWITCIAQLHNFFLASPRDALYSAGGVPLRVDPTGKAGTDVGQEIDLVANFHLDNHQDVLVGWSHLFAGDFIHDTAKTAQMARNPNLFYLQYSFRW